MYGKHRKIKKKRDYLRFKKYNCFTDVDLQAQKIWTRKNLEQE
jgi:hypothetical protein